jgi:hypothetical protein
MFVADAVRAVRNNPAQRLIAPSSFHFFLFRGGLLASSARFLRSWKMLGLIVKAIANCSRTARDPRNKQ